MEENKETEDLSSIKQNLYNEIKQQLIEELKDEDTKRREKLLQQRATAKKAREDYVNQMKESTDPWVEVLGNVETPQGVKVDLEWNDAFIEYLRTNGFTGTDEDAIVQKWITLLLRDMADTMDEEETHKSRRNEYV